MVDEDVVARRLFKPQFQNLWDWLQIRGGDGIIFGLAAYPTPHARAKRLMAMLIAHAAREYLKFGYTVLMATTDKTNNVAVSAYLHIGMQRIGLIEAAR